MQIFAARHHARLEREQIGHAIHRQRVRDRGGNQVHGLARERVVEPRALHQHLGQLDDARQARPGRQRITRRMRSRGCRHGGDGIGAQGVGERGGEN